MNAFLDVKNRPRKIVDAEGTVHSNFGAMAIGQGSKVFRADQSGVWLGAEKFADALFSVDMEGNLVSTSATISGYILVGGAGSDVNSGATLIDGGKVEADYFIAQAGTGQVLSGDFDVGTGAAGSSESMDGANNRIVVHDGTTNRIAIGNV